MFGSQPYAGFVEDILEFSAFEVSLSALKGIAFALNPQLGIENGRVLTSLEQLADNRLVTVVHANFQKVIDEISGLRVVQTDDDIVVRKYILDPSLDIESRRKFALLQNRIEIKPQDMDVEIAIALLEGGGYRPDIHDILELLKKNGCDGRIVDAVLKLYIEDDLKVIKDYVDKEQGLPENVEAK